MIKTHKDTNLKYLCKTSKQNPHKYPGSGKYWKNHLKKHGRNLSTEILFETVNIKEFHEKCLYYSKLYDVVKSKDWANEIPETGLDGGLTHSNPYWLIGHKHTEETKRKISESSINSVKIRKENGTYNPPFLNKTHSEETKQKMSSSSKGKPKSESHKLALSKAKLGVSLNLSDVSKRKHSNTMNNMLKQKYICSVCSKTGNAGHMTRYHKLCREKDPTWKKIQI